MEKSAPKTRQLGHQASGAPGWGINKKRMGLGPLAPVGFRGKAHSHPSPSRRNFFTGTQIFFLPGGGMAPISRVPAQGGESPTGHLLVWGYVMNALAQLGMVSDFPSDCQSDVVSFPEHVGEERTDYFVEKDGQKFAGTHLLIDLWGARNLDMPSLIDAALREGAIVAGATILHSHFHHFTPMAACRVWWCWRRVTSPSTHGRSATSQPSIFSCAALDRPAQGDTDSAGRLPSATHRLRRATPRTRSLRKTVLFLKKKNQKDFCPLCLHWLLPAKSEMFVQA